MRITEMIVAAFVATTITVLVEPYSAEAATFPGRVAISHDGNAHDCDDAASAAVGIALLAETGNASKLVAGIYADHVWRSEGSGWCQNTNGASREQMMRDSMVGTAERYGGFDMGAFVNARENPTAAVDKLTAAINASSSSDPLWIVAAGPMEVVGRAMSKAASSRRQYVTVVSHSNWNETHADNPAGGEPKHSGWTLSEIRSRCPGFKIVDLPDQNYGLNAKLSTFDGWRTSTNTRLRWLYERLKIQNPKVWDARVADISDVGMVTWLVDGRLDGDVQTSASEVKALL